MKTKAAVLYRLGEPLEIEEVELQAPKEGDQLFVNYFRDFSNLDLKAIVSYFHLPCTFIVP